MSLPACVTLWPARCQGPVRNGRGLLLVASGGLGDNVLLSKVIDRFLPLAEPGEPVTLLVRRDAAAVSFLFPDAVTVETYDWRRFRKSLWYRWSLVRALRRRRLRLVVSTDHERHPLVDELLIAACGAPALAEEARPSRKFARRQERNRAFFARLVAPPPEPSHRLRHWVSLANALTGQTLPLPSLAPPSLALDAAAGTRQPLVLLHPFSSDRRREVSPQVFARIVEAIPAGYRPALSAAPGDLEARPEWRDFVEQRRIGLDLSRLEEKFATLRQAAALVCVDTCLVHLGTLAGTPTFCLSTIGYRNWSVPYDDDFAVPSTRFYYDDCADQGCLGRCRYPLRDGRYRCLAELPLDRLIADLTTALAPFPIST